MNKPTISIIVVVLSLTFAFFYVVPVYDTVQERRSDLSSIEGIIRNSGKIGPLLEKTTSNLNGINRADLGRLAIILPEAIDDIRTSNNIQHIGLANRIILSGIKVEKPSAPKKSSVATSSVPMGEYVATKVGFTFESTYETFQLFLNDLEKSLGILNITSLVFTPVTNVAEAKNTKTGVASASKNPASQTYQFTVVLETYSLK